MSTEADRFGERLYALTGDLLRGDTTLGPGDAVKIAGLTVDAADAHIAEKFPAEPPAQNKEGAAYLRPEVLVFATAMEERLRANDHKPGWLDDSPEALFARLREEADELRNVFQNESDESDSGDWITLPGPLMQSNVLSEAADVANFAMMIADRVGALNVVASQKELGA